VESRQVSFGSDEAGPLLDQVKLVRFDGFSTVSLCIYLQQHPHARATRPFARIARRDDVD